MTGPSFVEVQPFRTRWSGLLVAVAGLSMVGFFGYAVVVQLILGQPLGDRPMPDGVLVLFAAMFSVLGVGLLVLGLGGKLVTEVFPDGVYVQFFPLTRRHRIAHRDIVSAVARTYRPIIEYGGWGVRGLGKRRAFNIAGNRGVQLSMSDGREWMIGSFQADELARAINAARDAAA